MVAPCPATLGAPCPRTSCLRALLLTTAVTLALAVIVVYDAANLRYYAGQNIRLTKQLARDVQEHLNTEFENPVYNIKLKDVLGHRWIEVFGGITLGCIVALMIHYLL